MATLTLRYRVRVNGREIARFTDPDDDAASLAEAQATAAGRSGDVKIDQYTPCCGWVELA